MMAFFVPQYFQRALFLSACLLGLTMASARARDSDWDGLTLGRGRDADYSLAAERDASARFRVALGAYAGWVRPGHGYPRYEDYGDAGVDFYLRPPVSDEPSLKNHYLIRLSADYVPLSLPPTANGITQELYSVNAAYVYYFARLNRPTAEVWAPFLGAGAGLYFDHISLDTPASGKVGSTDNHFGYHLSLGYFSPRFKNRWRLVPELRWHLIRYPSSYTATHLSVQVGLLWWPGESE
jgi:hypothetical protein